MRNSDPGSEEEDKWVQVSQGVQRKHGKHSKALFTPEGVDEASMGCSVDDIGDVRVTEGRTENGEEFVIEDFWRAAKNPQRLLEHKWTGPTTFKQRKRAAQEEISALRTLPNVDDQIQGRASPRAH